jgi:cytochrome c oxidase cbb3-type subunit 1
MAVRNPKKLRPYDQPPRRRRRLVPDGPDTGATAFLVMSLLWLVAATGIGALWTAQLLFPEQLAFTYETELPIIGTLGLELSQRTVISGFTNAVVFGWLSNAAFAGILFITPRITGARLFGEPLGFLAAVAWNLAVAGGLAVIYLPRFASSGRLAEFPLPFDGLMLLAFLIVTLLFFRTVLAAGQRLPYVSILFFGVALLAGMGAYALSSGLALLEFVFDLGDTTTALVTSFAARAIETYWILGTVLGALFYIVPRTTGNPLAGGGMALLAWLLWAAFAGLSAVGALVDPSIPYAVTTLGNVGTMLLVAPVFLSVASLAMTIQGRWSMTLSSGTMAFAAVAMAFLLATALLEAIGALRSVQGLVRPTEWPIGAWIFATLGAATFAFYALVDHAAPRALRRSWPGNFLDHAQMWLTLTGATLAGSALMAGGLAHGSLLREAASLDEVTATLSWFRLVAAGGLGLALLGGLAALVDLFLMYTTARRAEFVPVGGSDVPGAPLAPAGPAAPAAPAAH